MTRYRIPMFKGYMLSCSQRSFWCLRIQRYPVSETINRSEVLIFTVAVSFQELLAWFEKKKCMWGEVFWQMPPPSTKAFRRAYVEKILSVALQHPSPSEILWKLMPRIISWVFLYTIATHQWCKQIISSLLSRNRAVGPSVGTPNITSWNL